jgi:hypothetical protein
VGLFRAIGRAVAAFSVRFPPDAMSISLLPILSTPRARLTAHFRFLAASECV